MKILVFLFYVLYYFANASSQLAKPNGGQTKSLPVVDALISQLDLEQWRPDDGACLRATLDMLQGVRNNTLWATWVWDSMQLPAGSLYGAQAYFGNYDQCLQAPWSADQRHPGLRSQYCLVNVTGPSVDQIKTLGPFDDTEEYYQTPTKDGRRFNQHYIGVCLPSICSTSSVVKISQHLLRLTHLPDGDVTVDPRNCQTAGEKLEYPTGFYVFWSVLGMLFAITTFSTLFRSDDEKETVLAMITHAFCVKRNCRGLVVVTGDEVKVMHGMRFITAVIIVFIHDPFFAIWFPFVNGLDLNKFLTSPWGIALLHAEIAVDTFFAMSGLLLIRGLMIGKQRNVLFTLVKRYLRLIGPFALCVLFYATTIEYMVSGPKWMDSIREEKESCEKYWWKSLLMANTDVTTVCHCVTWYISADFQMAILGSFLFFVFRRNRKLGVTAFLAVAASLTIHLGLTVFRKQMDIVPFNFGGIAKFRTSTYLNYTYFSSYARAGPYLVGMLMGYIITTYKPSEHKNVTDKKWSVIITAAALLVGGSMMSVGAIFAGRPYDALEAAVVVATNRAFWGIAVCALIGVCEYGSLSLIPSFLGWSGFVPLSKLSYCIYLLHPIVLEFQKFSARSAATYSVFNVEAAERAFQAITEEDWKNSCHHVIKIEKESCERELTMYEEIERLVINLEDDSSSTSDSEHDSDEFAASSSQDMDVVGVEYLEEDLLE